MAETSVGKIGLDLEAKPKLDKDSQQQIKQIAKRVKEMFANLDEDIFKNLTQGFQEAMENMTDIIKEQTEKSKSLMKSFIADLASMKVNVSPINMFQDDENESKPNSRKGTPNKTRGPPSIVKMSKIQLDDIFNDEMMKQHISELELQLDQLDDKVLNLQQKRKMLLETYSDGMDPKAENELNAKAMNLDSQISAVLDKMTRLNIELKAFDRQKAKGGQTVNPDSSMLANAITQIKGKFQGMVSSLGSTKIGGIFLSGVAGAKSFIRVLTALKTAASKVVTVIRQGFNAVAATIRKATTPVLRFGKVFYALTKTTRHPINTIRNGFNKLRSSITGVSKSAGSSRSSFGQLVKSFFVFSMIFPLVSRGIMALMTSLKDGLMTNAQFATSCNQIKTNLMAAFMPIYQAILPALNTLMGAIAKVTAMLAGFIANLFGKTYSQSVQAAQGLQDAKEAMNGYGNAAKDTAKKLGSLASIDEINVLNSNSGADSGGSGGGEASKPLIPTDFDEGIVSDFAKKLKDLFNKGDFKGIGKLIGEKINDSVLTLTNYISWDRVGAQIKSAIQNITDLLNSAIDTINWENIGRLIGAGIDTISRTIYLFMSNMNWDSIGSAFANGINGIIYSVDWAQFGATLGTFLQASISGLYDFVTTFDWASLGKALADGIMGMVNHVDWNQFASTLANGIMGAVKGIHNFVVNMDWSALGNKIASSINTFFSIVDWRNLSSTASSFARGLWKALIKAVSNIDWYAIGEAIADFLCGLDYVGIAVDTINLLGQALIGATKLLTGFAVKLGKNLVEGLWDGICSLMSGIGNWIKEEFVDPFVNGVKEFFGIHSPSTVMMDIGKDLIRGLFNGIKSLVGWLIEGIGGFFGGIGEKIGQIWDGIKSTASDVWNGITGFLGDTWNGIKDMASNTWDSVKSGVSSTWDGIKSATSNVWNEVTGFLGDTWDGLKNVAADTWDNIKSGASEAWDNIKTGVSSKWSDIKSGIGGFIGDISDTITGGFNKTKSPVFEACLDIKNGVVSKFTEMTTGLSGVPGKLFTIGKGMFNKMKDGVNSTIGKVKTAVSTGMDKATACLKDLSKDSKIWGKDLADGMAKGIQNNASKIGAAVGNIAKNITSLLHFSRPDEGPLREYETWMPDMVEGLTNTLNKSAPRLIEGVQNMASAMMKAMELETPDIAFVGHKEIDITKTVKQDSETMDKQDTIITYLGLILAELMKDKDVMCHLQVMLGAEKLKDVILKLNKESIAKTGKPLLGI